MKQLDINDKFWVVKFYKKLSVMIGHKHNNKMFHISINWLINLAKELNSLTQTEADWHYINNKIPLRTDFKSWKLATKM